jgi:hypothetical protein
VAIWSANPKLSWLGSRNISIALKTRSPGSKRVIAFHENAGGCQVNFDFVFVFAFLRFTFLPSGEIVQSRPERSRARLVLGAAQRTLDGEDGSAIVRLGRKVSILSLQFVICISACTLWTSQHLVRPTTVATLPSALGLSFFLRSVQVGCSRFQPALQPDFRPLVHLTIELGQAIDAVAGTRRLNSGLVVWCVLVLKFRLGRCL